MWIVRYNPAVVDDVQDAFLVFVHCVTAVCWRATSVMWIAVVAHTCLVVERLWKVVGARTAVLVADAARSTWTVDHELCYHVKETLLLLAVGDFS